MTTEVKIHKVGNDAVISRDGDKALVTISGLNPISTSGATPDSPEFDVIPDSRAVEQTSKEWAIWGDNDTFPNDLQDKLLNLGVARSALGINSDFHFGNGIQWVKEDKADPSVIKYIISNPDNWREWAYTSGFYSALSDGINSLDSFNISVIRVRMAKGGSIYSFDTLDTPNIRLGKRDSKGFINEVYYAHNIHEKMAKDETIKTYKVYDPSNHDAFLNKNKTFVFILRERTWGRFYYPEPNYYATIRNGWADIALEVPKLIKNIYKNQATLKYHVKIPLSVFKAKHGVCWDEKTEKERLEIIANFKIEVESIISKAEAAGQSVFTIYEDGLDKTEITPIQDAINTQKDLSNNIAANSVILFAIGIAPSIIGLNMPGGKDLNGSGGSQLRESIKAKQATLTRERIKTLEFCYFVKRVMNFDKDIQPMFVDLDISQTLDQNPTGKKNVVQG